MDLQTAEGGMDLQTAFLKHRALNAETMAARKEKLAAQKEEQRSRLEDFYHEKLQGDELEKKLGQVPKLIEKYASPTMGFVKMWRVLHKKFEAEAHRVAEAERNWREQELPAKLDEVASASAAGARALHNLSLLYAAESSEERAVLMRSWEILEATIRMVRQRQRQGGGGDGAGADEEKGGGILGKAAVVPRGAARHPMITAAQVAALPTTPPAQVLDEMQSADEQGVTMQAAADAADKDYDGFVQTTEAVGKVVKSFAVAPAPSVYQESAAAVAAAGPLKLAVTRAAKKAAADPSPATLAALKEALNKAAAAKLTAEAKCAEIVAGLKTARSVELWLALSAELKAAGTDRDAVTAVATHITQQREAIADKPFAPVLAPVLRAILDQAPSTTEDLATAATSNGLQYALRWGECLQTVAKVIADERPPAAAGDAAVATAAQERAEALARLAAVKELFPVLEHAQLGEHAGKIIAGLDEDWDCKTLEKLNELVGEEDIGKGELKSWTGETDSKQLKMHLTGLRSAVKTFTERLSSWGKGGGDGGGEGKDGGGDEKEKTQLPYEDIEVHEELGKGAFGTVNRATLSQKTTTGKVIKKMCAAKRLRGAAFQDPRKIRMILDECHIMFDTDHAFICACLGHARAAEDLLMVMEYCDGGDLLGRARKAQAIGEPMSRAEVLQLCLMAASAIKYIHSKGLIHRDIAARNFLIAVTPDGVVLCKMADFGMSRKMEDDKDYYALDSTAEKDAEGKVVNLEIPVAWSAPECFEKQLGKDGEKHYIVGPPNDVWAFNVTAFEVASGGLEPYLEPGTICETDASGKVVQDSLDSRAYITKFVRDGGRLVVPRAAPVSLQGTMQHCWAAGTAAADRQTMPQVIDALCADELHKAREWGSQEWRAFLAEVCGIALSDDEDQVAKIVECWDDDDYKEDDELFKDSTYDAEHFKDPAVFAQFKRELAGLRGLLGAWDKKVLDADKL